MSKTPKHPIKKVSDSERRIGLRLAYLRGYYSMEQATLAAKLGLTRAQLSTIESGRVALRFQTGWNACILFDIHPQWLACGRPEEPFPSLNPRLKTWIEAFAENNKTTLFSTAWSSIFPIAFDETEEGKAFLEKLLESKNAPVLNLGDSEIQTEGEKKSLQQSSELRSSRNMQSELEELLTRARRITEARGMKARLAFDLGVPKPRITEWLSGKYEPSGAITLKLLKWVQEHEAKQP